MLLVTSPFYNLGFDLFIYLLTHNNKILLTTRLCMKAGNIEYNKALDLPDALSVIIAKSILILPQTYVPLIIHTTKHLKLIKDALKTNSLLGTLQINPTSNCEAVYEMGTIARITSFSEIGDGKLSIALEGICRFYCLKKLTTHNPYESFIIKPILEDFTKETFFENNIKIKEMAQSYLNSLNLEEHELAKEMDKFVNVPSETLVNSLCVSAAFDPAEQQMLLEAEDLAERIDIFLALNQRRILRQKGLLPKDLQ